MDLQKMSQCCPECGCNDAEKNGRVAMWGKTWQRWRCTNCGTEYNEAPEDRPAEAEVVYHVMCCPNCNGDDISTTRTVRPKRYHKCNTCNFTFSSTEHKDIHQIL